MNALVFRVCVSAMAGWVNRGQQQVIEYLLEGNRVLREQLGGRRLRLTDTQRRRLAVRARALGRKAVMGIACIVTSDTLLRWYRNLVARKYDGNRRRGPGWPEVLVASRPSARERPGMPEKSFTIEGDEVVFTDRATAPRALHCMRERSKATGGDGSDEGALALLDEWGGEEWEDDLRWMEEWDNPALANWLLVDALNACLPESGLGFDGGPVEQLWVTARREIQHFHERFGRSDAAESLLLDALRAALREDGAETLRLVRAAIAEWRALS